MQAQVKVKRLPLTEKTVFVDLSKSGEQKCYDGVLANALAAYFQYLELEGRDRFKFAYKLLVWLLRLRQAATHWMLLLGREETIQYVPSILFVLLASVFG